MSERVVTMTLHLAEGWMRHVAASSTGSDTGDAFALVMAELDRLREVAGEPKPRVVADRDQPPGEGRVRS